METSLTVVVFILRQTTYLFFSPTITEEPPKMPCPPPFPTNQQQFLKALALYRSPPALIWLKTFPSALRKRKSVFSYHKKTPSWYFMTGANFIKMILKKPRVCGVSLRRTEMHIHEFHLKVTSSLRHCCRMNRKIAKARIAHRISLFSKQKSVLWWSWEQHW